MLPRTRAVCSLVGAVFLLLASLPPAAPAQAAGTFTVNSTLDEEDASAADPRCRSASDACTLRAAVQQARAQPNGQLASYTINLPAGTYRLTLPGIDDLGKKGDLDLGDAAQPSGNAAVTLQVSIVGAGAADTVIDGNRSETGDRVFDIGSNADVRISGVTIRGGRGAAGFFGHTHGGGIHNHGRLRLEQSALVDNEVSVGQAPTGGAGGGLTNAGGSSATLVNVTVSGNRSNSTNSPVGGGIENRGTLSLLNVTVAENTSAGGNGIYNASTAYLTSSLLADNRTLIGGDAPNCGGTGAAPINSGGHNLESHNGCNFFQDGDQINTDPELGALAGGVHPLAADSPAVDAGARVGCPPTDQRGLARPKGLGCEIGAYEFDAPVQYSLTVEKLGTGTGRVSGEQINCGKACVGWYAPGTAVSLRATPDDGFRFSGWGGACAGRRGCRVRMDAYQDVLARFNRPGDCKPPRARFKARQLEGDIAVEFRGKFKIGRGCSLDFHALDFGDGTKSPTNPVTHAYPQPGTYEAEFRVVDSIQQEMIVRKTVVVREVLP